MLHFRGYDCGYVNIQIYIKYFIDYIVSINLCVKKISDTYYSDNLIANNSQTPTTNLQDKIKAHQKQKKVKLLK